MNELKTTKGIQIIFEESCYDCHSNKTKWPWYSNIAPISWIINKDVYDAREWLNFSEWESYDDYKKRKLKKLIFREINGAMPMQIYLLAHQNARLNNKQKECIRQWCDVTMLDVNMRD